MHSKKAVKDDVRYLVQLYGRERNARHVGVRLGAENGWIRMLEQEYRANSLRLGESYGESGRGLSKVASN